MDVKVRLGFAVVVIAQLAFVIAHTDRPLTFDPPPDSPWIITLER